MISVVVPVYNEEAVIVGTLDRLHNALGGLPYQWEIIIVNDGSTDGTLACVKNFVSTRLDIVVVELSRNFGKEAALSAGIDVASGAAVIPIDADLQDPPELIAEMIEIWKSGADVVLGRRKDRSSDTWIKRTFASQFYRLINAVSEVPIPDNVGDFRLMDRMVVDALRLLPENRRFMKGLFAWAGFRTAQIEYTRHERSGGATKFTGLQLLNLGIEGITSFSTAPLRIATYAGAVVAAMAILYAAFIIARTIIVGIDVPGYSSLISVVLLMSGIQLIAIGLIGEYVGRAYIESKRRPAYVVRRIWRRGRGAAEDSALDERRGDREGRN